MRWKEKLDPIHYDSDLFLDLVERVEEYSSPNIYLGNVTWDNDNSEVEFDDPRELIDDRTIPDRILSFELTMYADEGKIMITADGQNGREFHRLIIRGDDDEWVKTNLSNITEFENRQRNRLRKWLKNRYLWYLQLLLIGSMLSVVLPYAVTYLHPAFHFPIPQGMMLLAGVQMLLIGLLEVPKRIYPYIVLTRNGTKPLHRTIISVVIPLLSVLGVVLAAVGHLS